MIKDDVNAIHELVKKINLACDDLIVDYQVYQDVGAVYFKCKYIKFEYDYLHNQELLKRFDSVDKYLEFCIDSVIQFSSTVWPYWMSDFGGPNTKFSKDLKCIVIDFDDMIEPHSPIDQQQFIEYVVDNLSRHTRGLFELEYAETFIKNYLEKNISKLDYMK